MGNAPHPSSKLSHFYETPGMTFSNISILLQKRVFEEIVALQGHRYRLWEHRTVAVPLPYIDSQLDPSSRLSTGLVFPMMSPPYFVYFTMFRVT